MLIKVLIQIIEKRNTIVSKNRISKPTAETDN